ncbi:MAG: SagB/ThcOx family dehydrogenase [Desulfobacterales bacterium]
MKLYMLIISVIFMVSIMIFPIGKSECMSEENVTVKMPQPQYESQFSLESAILKRRSVRNYVDEPLTLSIISQLLWAAQGITHPRGFRTAPSAGALYPLEIYIIAGKVTNLAAGIYKYKPRGHELLKIIEGDKRTELYRVALRQRPIKDAPVILVFCAVYKRTTGKYRKRGIRYILIEIGHSSQNVCLQAVSLDLGTVTLGAFNDKKVSEVIGCKENEHPLYIMPIGKHKR